MLELQDVVREVSVWPDNVKGWVTLIGSVMALMAMTGGAVGRWLSGRLGVLRENLEQKINLLTTETGRETDAVSERLRECEARGSKFDGRLDQLERQMDKASYERKGYDERLGRIEGVVETMANTINRHREQSEREIRLIRESVAEIQATVNAFGEMKNDLMTLAGRMLSNQQRGDRG